jgi:hypothetical protein
MSEPAADPAVQTAIEVLTQGEMRIVGQFENSSNYTFLTELSLGDQKLQAVYKPIRGEYPLWDFPDHTLAKRETAAFVLSEWLGWHLVPATVFRRNAPLGAGSLQTYIEHDPERHYFALSTEEIQLLKPIALFDLIINNADRKGSHLFFDAANRLWCIDHGLCFHRQDKLRTVIWDFRGETVPEPLLADISQAQAPLKRGGELFTRLHSYLAIPEIQMLSKRIAGLIETPIFPQPPTDRRAFPYPPL